MHPEQPPELVLLLVLLVLDVAVPVVLDPVLVVEEELVVDVTLVVLPVAEVVLAMPPVEPVLAVAPIPPIPPPLLAGALLDPVLVVAWLPLAPWPVLVLPEGAPPLDEAPEPSLVTGGKQDGIAKTTATSAPPANRPSSLIAPIRTPLSRRRRRARTTAAK